MEGDGGILPDQLRPKAGKASTVRLLATALLPPRAASLYPSPRHAPSLLATCSTLAP